MYLQEIGFQVVDRADWPRIMSELYDVNMATKISGLIKSGDKNFCDQLGDYEHLKQGSSVWSVSYVIQCMLFYILCK